MHEGKFNTWCLYFTGIITMAIWSLLAWDHYHGGVPSHHLFHRKELPAISNWWSGLLIPLLSWFLLYRVQKGIIQNKEGSSQELKFPKSILYGFAAALFYGALISVFFTYDFTSVPWYMILGILLIAFFYPVYRAECMLGFVLGMTFTFGAFISTAVACIFSLAGLLIYRVICPAIWYMVTKIFHRPAAGK